jgi:hypothetical protein
VCNGLGTWREVEEQIDLHRLDAVLRHWSKAPPLSELVVAFFSSDDNTPARGAEAFKPSAENGGISPEFRNLFAAAGGLVG